MCFQRCLAASGSCFRSERQASMRGKPSGAWSQESLRNERREENMNTQYGFGKTVSYPFGDAIERITAALQKEGFGILSDIDVAATLKKNLNHDLPPFRIQRTNNPPQTQKTIEAEPSIGLLLPCNVVVRED